MIVPRRKKLFRRNENGQAATEFIIAAVFVLVPLFLIIPLLGKYIDIRHAAIQQARYETWEYTVWSGPKEKILDGIKQEQSAGRKKFEDTRNEGIGYFFGNPYSSTYGTPGSTFTVNPLWRDHRGLSLFPNETKTISSGDIKERKTPDPTAGIFDFVLKLLSDVISLFGDLLHIFGVKAKFDAIYTNGYFTSNVNVKVRSIDDILPQYSLADVKSDIAKHPLEIKAKAAVLTNGWNAGSSNNAISESRGLVFTALLKPVSDTINTAISWINKLLSWIPLFQIKLPGMPDFGYVQDDLVPYEHLEDNKKELKEKYGLYYYKDKK